MVESIFKGKSLFQFHFNFDVLGAGASGGRVIPEGHARAAQGVDKTIRQIRERLKGIAVRWTNCWLVKR